MTRNSTALLLLVYIVASFFMFAIVRYLFFFVWNLDPLAEDVLVTTRVFLSAPALILIGALLLLKYKNLIHRLFGLLFLGSGIIWAFEIIRTFSEEAA